jgi:hypothetical protein
VIQVWTPDGMRDSEEYKVDVAVKEYDERLSFGLFQGDYVVSIAVGPSDPPYPIFNFGRICPLPHEVVERLYSADAIRHGEQILKDLNAHNLKIETEIDKSSDDATEALAEAIESAMHRRGELRYSRSLPKKDPKQLNKGW